MTKKSVKLTAEKSTTYKKIIKDILFRRLVELERYDFLQTAPPMVFKAIKKNKKRCKYYLQTITNQCLVFLKITFPQYGPYGPDHVKLNKKK